MNLHQISDPNDPIAIVFDFLTERWRASYTIARVGNSITYTNRHDGHVETYRPHPRGIDYLSRLAARWHEDGRTRPATTY